MAMAPDSPTFSEVPRVDPDVLDGGRCTAANGGGFVGAHRVGFRDNPGVTPLAAQAHQAHPALPHRRQGRHRPAGDPRHPGHRRPTARTTPMSMTYVDSPGNKVGTQPQPAAPTRCEAMAADDPRLAAHDVTPDRARGQRPGRTPAREVRTFVRQLLAGRRRLPFVNTRARRPSDAKRIRQRRSGPYKAYGRHGRSTKHGTADDYYEIAGMNCVPVPEPGHDLLPVPRRRRPARGDHRGHGDPADVLHDERGPAGRCASRSRCARSPRSRSRRSLAYVPAESAPTSRCPRSRAAGLRPGRRGPRPPRRPPRAPRAAADDGCAGAPAHRGDARVPPQRTSPSTTRSRRSSTASQAPSTLAGAAEDGVRRRRSPPADRHRRCTSGPVAAVPAREGVGDPQGVVRRRLPRGRRRPTRTSPASSSPTLLSANQAGARRDARRSSTSAQRQRRQRPARSSTAVMAVPPADRHAPDGRERLQHRRAAARPRRGAGDARRDRQRALHRPSWPRRRQGLPAYARLARRVPGVRVPPATRPTGSCSATPRCRRSTSGCGPPRRRPTCDAGLDRPTWPPSRRSRDHGPFTLVDFASSIVERPPSSTSAYDPATAELTVVVKLSFEFVDAAQHAGGNDEGQARSASSTADGVDRRRQGARGRTSSAAACSACGTRTRRPSAAPARAGRTSSPARCSTSRRSPKGAGEHNHVQASEGRAPGSADQTGSQDAQGLGVASGWGAADDDRSTSSTSPTRSPTRPCTATSTRSRSSQNIAPAYTTDNRRLAAPPHASSARIAFAAGSGTEPTDPNRLSILAEEILRLDVPPELAHLHAHRGRRRRRRRRRRRWQEASEPTT